MNNNRTELSVNTEVLEKMAEIATKEVDGVIGISKRSIDLKGAVKSKNAFKGVKIESVNGAVKIKVYICVDQNANVKTVAEKVQQTVKDKVQNMTGTAVTQVDVIVADVKFEDGSAEAFAADIENDDEIADTFDLTTLYAVVNGDIVLSQVK